MYSTFLSVFLLESIVICAQFKDVFVLASTASSIEKTRIVNQKEKRMYCDSSRNMSNVMNRILKNSAQDVHTVPKFDAGEPVEIKLALSVLAFRDVKEVDMTYTVDFFLRTTWVDRRLRHSLGCILTMTMGKKHPAEIIWVPDTMIENSVTSSLHEVLTNNHKINISPDGEVFWSTRVTIKAMCQMNLMKFPNDKQTCTIVLLSYTYPNELVQYVWDERSPVVVMKHALSHLSQFDVTSSGKKNYSIKYAAGVYSILEASFVFERRLQYYLIQVYIPCVFLVALAGLSFWVDVKDTAARVALGLTTLLTIATIWAAANANMPPVNYVKAIDIYFLSSFCFVLATLLEYIVVLKYNTVEQHVRRSVSTCKEFKKPKSCRNKDKTSEHSHRAECVHKQSVSSTHDAVLDNTESYNEYIDEGGNITWEKNNMVVKNIENVVRFLYPGAYLIFNLVYWLYIIV